MVSSFTDARTVLAKEALNRLPTKERDGVPVSFNAHSMPKRVAGYGSEYVDQLEETANSVARWLGLAPERWHFAYPSKGHTP